MKSLFYDGENLPLLNLSITHGIREGYFVKRSRPP